MKAMLLAAGRGERMRSLTERLPKPLIDVGGRPLIEHHLVRLRNAGISDVVVNLAFGGAQIRERLGDGERFGLAIRYSDEGDVALETGGGIIHALPLLGTEPFVLVNSDVFTDFDFGRLCVGARLGTLVLVENPPHNPGGDFGLADDERVTLEPPLLTFAGISVLSPALFDGWAPGRRPLKPILDAAIAQRALGGLRYAGPWLDVGTPERLAQARALAAAPGRA
jgi:N-acetyl-alpha-D-muramate 1-phosphate uridylyltransferase